MPLLTNQPSRLLGRKALWYRYGGAPVPVAVYQPKGAASLAASYVNLANPGTYNAAPGTAPTFATATGWTFAAASLQYLTTGLVPVTDQTWSMIARFSGLSGLTTQAGAQVITTGDSRLALVPVVSNNTQRAYGNGKANTITGSVTSGVMAVAGPNCYVNGAADGTIAAGTDTNTRELYIGARNNNGTADNFLNGSIVALAVYNVVLTAAQVAAITTAMSLL